MEEPSVVHVNRMMKYKITVTQGILCMSLFAFYVTQKARLRRVERWFRMEKGTYTGERGPCLRE